MRWPGAAPSCGSSADEAGRTNRSLLDVDGAALVVSPVHALRGHAPGSPAGVHGRGRTRAGGSALRALRERAARRSASAWRRGGSGRRWRSSSSTTGRSRSGSTAPSGPRRRRRAGARTAGAAEGYFADLVRVRRQRVQTSARGRDAADVDDERLEVRLVAAVGADAVHPGRLGVEAAHRCLAADRAGAGHAWSSGVVISRVEPRTARTEAVGYHTASDAQLGRRPTRPTRRTSPACHPR